MKQLAAVSLLLVLVAGCSKLPTPSVTPPSAIAPAVEVSTVSPRNEALLAAAGTFETLTEMAESGDLAGMDQALTEVQSRKINPQRNTL